MQHDIIAEAASSFRYALGFRRKRTPQYVVVGKQCDEKGRVDKQLFFLFGASPNEIRQCRQWHLSAADGVALTRIGLEQWQAAQVARNRRPPSKLQFVDCLSQEAWEQVVDREDTAQRSRG